MDKNIDFEIYPGQTFSSLCREVIDRSTSKKDQLDTIISDARVHIKDLNGVIMFLPQIKSLLEVGVKNDEQLIKLAGVIQKQHALSVEVIDPQTGGLSEEEKEQLLNNSLSKEVINIKQQIESINSSTAITSSISSSL